MDNIVVRQLHTEDAESIIRIYSAIVKEPVNPDFKKLIHHYADQRYFGCFVAEQNGNVVGFLISYTLLLGFGVEKSAWISVLCVDPTLMGEGIGAQMVEKAYSLYKEKGITRVYTSVSWDMPDMLSFFKTQGFEKSDHITLKIDL